MISGSIGSKFTKSTLVRFFEMLLEHGERAFGFVHITPRVAIRDEELFFFEHGEGKVNGSGVRYFVRIVVVSIQTEELSLVDAEP